MRYLKSLVWILTLAAGLFSSAANVCASNLHLLLGADFVNSNLQYKGSNHSAESREKNFKNVSGVIGLTAYGIGLEAFILNTTDDDDKDSLRNKIRAYGFDVFGEANLSDNFTLIASLGLAKYKITNSYKRFPLVPSDKKKTTETNNGPRFGIGIQYYLTNNIAIISMYHYTLLNSNARSNYNSVSEVSAGLRLIF